MHHVIDYFEIVLQNIQVYNLIKLKYLLLFKIIISSFYFSLWSTKSMIKTVKNKWLFVPQNKVAPDIRIICFPYAGGSSATYMQWKNELPKNVELVIIQAPGKGARMFEPLHHSMSELIDDLLQHISPVLEKPYVLLGHSLGSRVAFELMVKLQERGSPLPEHFFALGSRGPHIYSEEEISYKLPDAEFIEHIKTLNGTPQEILDNQEMMKFLMPILRADFKISETYTYKGTATFDIPLSVLGGIEDKAVSLYQLQSWKGFFSKPMDLHQLAGDHFFIDTNKQGVLKIVNKVLLLNS